MIILQCVKKCLRKMLAVDLDSKDVALFNNRKVIFSLIKSKCKY